MQSNYIVPAAALATALVVLPLARAADAQDTPALNRGVDPQARPAGISPVAGISPLARVFGGAQVQEVYRVLLDRDALLLESILDVIRQKDVQDGEVLVTAGSVQECTYHYVASLAAKSKNVYKTVKGPFEILNAGGIIAAGEPHIHITLSTLGKGGFGGHLENGCRILYLAEVTILKYSGPALIRKENQNGISLLQLK